MFVFVVEDSELFIIVAAHLRSKKYDKKEVVVGVEVRKKELVE